MTCRGYDSKAVKISKTVKRAASKIRDNHERGAFIRSYVRVAESESRSAGRREK